MAAMSINLINQVYNNRFFLKMLANRIKLFTRLKTLLLLAMLLLQSCRTEEQSVLTNAVVSTVGSDQNK